MASAQTATVPAPEQPTDLAPAAKTMLLELLESSQNLPSIASEVGSVQYGLREVRKIANKLRPPFADDNDTKAHYLLAGSGVNAEDIASELQAIASHQLVEPATLAAPDQDIDVYIRTKREENILASIEESIRSTARDFDVYLAQNITVDWEQRKRQILTHFGLASKTQSDQTGPFPEVSANAQPRSPPPVSRSWGKASLGRLVLGPAAETARGDFTDVDPVQRGRSGSGSEMETSIVSKDTAAVFQTKSRRHARVVVDLNVARAEGKSFAIAHEFGLVSKYFGGDLRSQQMHDAWNIVADLAGETPKKPVTPRRFVRSRLVGDQDSYETMKMRKHIIKGSRKFLEKQFYTLIEYDIAKNPQEAQLGGVPSVLNKVKAYTNLKFRKAGKWTHSNLEKVNDMPVWAMLYFLIRSGHVKEALEFTVQIESSLKKIERSFPTYLKAFAADPEHRLPKELLERLHTEFNQHIRQLESFSDPYKYALYKIIGRCELSRKVFPDIVDTTEDWLWVHLMLTREGDGELDPLNGKYGLQDLQNLVVQFGAKQFNPANSTPGLYFQVLLLVGLFERAVHYACSFSKVDAVHFAIALTYYGLLNPVSDIERFSSELLVVNGDELPQLNFARLIGSYTRDFRRSDPCDAVEYLVLLCLNGDLPEPKGKMHLEMCHESLKELLLETREFSKLLGDIRSDGVREPGAIEQKMQLINISDPTEFLHSITEEAAIKATEYGRTADSILLYQLSEEYDTVVSIVNKCLGEFLSVVEIGRPMDALPTGVPLVLSATDDPAQLARNMMEVYSSNATILAKVSQRNRETCAILLQMVHARDLFADRKWDACLKEVEGTGVLTLAPSTDAGQVRKCAQQFLGLHESIARNVPSLLIMMMQCLVGIAQSLNESAYTNSGRFNKIGDLRVYARNCMIYAGMIQYRMPREVYSQLTNLEILL